MLLVRVWLKRVDSLNVASTNLQAYLCSLFHQEEMYDRSICHVLLELPQLANLNPLWEDEDDSETEINTTNKTMTASGENS